MKMKNLENERLFGIAYLSDYSHCEYNIPNEWMSFEEANKEAESLPKCESGHYIIVEKFFDDKEGCYDYSIQRHY